jgi:hypothetical protein
MSDLPFKFPILRIPEPNTGGRWEDLVDFDYDGSHFSVGNRESIYKQIYVGNLIMDAKGRTWRLLKLVDLGIGGKTFWEKFFAQVFGSHAIRYDLSEELKMPFSEIKERVCATVLANPDAYRGEKVLEEGDLSPEREKALLEQFLGNVRAAATPRELIAAMEDNDYV